MIEEKIALGTVQFGLNYGINNKTGQVTESEVCKIFEIAKENNINILDTAHLYGNSEEVIGKCLEKTNLEFNIITKLPDCQESEIEKVFNLSLERLKIKKVYGLLFHHFKSFKSNPHIFDALKDLKLKGFVKKIGFSLYFPEELELLFDKKVEFDIVQIPFNILDQRFLNYFSSLKDHYVEIHVRSVFLQGLLFKRADELSPFFNKVRNKIKKIHNLSVEKNISISDLCLNFVSQNHSVDKMVVGIDNSFQLKELLKYHEKENLISEMSDFLSDLRENDEKIILPFNWNN